MAKKVESKETEEIRKALESDKLIIGTERTMKEFKRGELSKLFLSSNCPDAIKEDISHYSSLTDVEIVELDILNEDLGVVCKKPFSVSIVGLKK